MTLSTSGKGIFFSDLCEGRTESSPAKSNQLWPGLSNYSGAQWEPHCLSGKTKRGPPKDYQSRFRLLQGIGDFKGQIPVTMCIRHRDKVTTATQEDPVASLDEAVQTDINTFYTEKRRGRPRPRKGRKGKRQGMPRCWPPSREALWQIPSPWRTRHEANA